MPGRNTATRDGGIRPPYHVPPIKVERLIAGTRVALAIISLVLATAPNDARLLMARRAYSMLWEIMSASGSAIAPVVKQAVYPPAALRRSSI